MKKALFFVLLISVTSAIADHDIPGTYLWNQNKLDKLVIDESLHVKTTLVMRDYTIFARTPLVFPHRLRWNELKNVFTTSGYYSFVYSYYGRLIRCQFPIEMEADSYGEGRFLDVTLSYPPQFGLNAWGQCAYFGLASEPLAFEKITVP